MKPEQERWAAAAVKAKIVREFKAGKSMIRLAGETRLTLDVIEQIIREWMLKGETLKLPRDETIV